MIDEDSKTLWCGNLAEQVKEELLYELFLQAGPLEKVLIPRDREGRQKNFAFITFRHDVSVPYAMNLFRGTALFHRALSLQCRAKMAPLPPPIRCTSFDQSFDNQNQTNIKQQFADMTRTMHDDGHNTESQQFNGPDLVMASLQGNWSHRHHPYRNSNNNDKRGHKNYHDRNAHSDYRNEPKSSRDWRNKHNSYSGSGRYKQNKHRRDY